MNHVINWVDWTDEETLMSWTTVTTKCPVTNQEFDVVIKAEDFNKWQDGGMVQQIFHYLSKGERELLQTGTCAEGWAIIFPNE